MPPGSPWPRGKPARSISQAAEVLTRPSGSGKRGGRPCSAARSSSAANASSSRIGFVKNEPADTVSGSAGSSTMPLPRRSPSTASRTVGERRSLPRRDRERARELGIGQRRRQLAPLEREGDREHDPAAGGALERARAIGEAAGVGGQLLDHVALAVEHAHRHDRLGHLLPVGADVLDRRRADRAGDARQALHAREPLGHAARHEPLPLLARLHGQLDAPVALALLDPRRQHPHDGAGEAVVGDHEVRAAGEEQQRPGLAAHGREQLGFAARLHERPRGPAEAQGGQLAQVGHGRRD